MKEVVLIVRGMTCASCVNAVVGQVEALEGVSSCDVSLVTSECKVVSEYSIATDGIIDAVDDCGFVYRDQRNDMQLVCGHGDQAVGSYRRCF